MDELSKVARVSRVYPKGSAFHNVVIEGDATDNLILTNFQMSKFLELGMHICPGCGRSLVAGQMFCGPCNDRVMEMEEIIRPRYSWKHPNVIMAGLAAFWAIAILAWWLA